MSVVNLKNLITSFQVSVSSILEQSQVLSLNLSYSPQDPDDIFTLSESISDLKTTLKILSKYINPPSLNRSQSTDPVRAKNLPLSDVIRFFSIGRYLLDPASQEFVLKSIPDTKTLSEFLSLYNSFTISPSKSLFKTFQDLEISLKHFLKKSNKTILTQNSSYGLLSQFCDKLIQTFSKSPLSAAKVIKSTSAPTQKLSSKVLSLEEAVSDIQDNSSLIIGGFGVVGSPETVLKAIHSKSLKGLSISTCLAGTRDSALGQLVLDKQVSRLHISHIGSNTEVERQFLNGELEVEFSTQGSLVERFRAGAMGIHSFYTPSGSGTFIENGSVPIKFSLNGKIEKSTTPRECFKENGEKFFLEKSIRGDFAIIKAWKADTEGNLIYKSTAKNSNPDIAGCCKVTIAEVEEILPAGQLHPDQVHTPGIFIHRVVLSDSKDKYIERLTFRKDGGVNIPGTAEQIFKREKIARRAAKEITSGMYINLGIGIPTLIPNFLNEGVEIVLQGENGVLGIGPYPEQGMHDPDTVNAGRETITINPGGSTFSSTSSFGMIRGNHIDITFLGGFQVSQFGDLANWIVPEIKVKGMGGAIDLVCSRAKCIVCMEHLNFGRMKLLKKCDLPLTGEMVVDKLITDLGVFEFRKEGMALVEISEGVSLDDLRTCTTAEFSVDESLKIM